MANEKKINAIADAEQAGLYYSSNTEEGFTRKVEGENQIFLNSKGKPVKGKRDLKRIEEMRIPPAWTDVWICTEEMGIYKLLELMQRREHSIFITQFGPN